MTSPSVPTPMRPEDHTTPAIAMPPTTHRRARPVRSAFRLLTLGFLTACAARPFPQAAPPPPLNAAPIGSAVPTARPEPVLLPVPDDPTISYAVSFQVGSEHDPVGKEGLAFLTGSLLAEGATKSHSYDEILRKLDPLASTYTVVVDHEMSTLTGRTHRDNVAAYFPLFREAFTAPAFVQADFERLKAEQESYLEKQLRYASDEELGKAALHAAVFAGTRFAHPPQGTVAGLKAITLDDVRGFYATHFTQGAASPAIGGGYDAKQADELTRSLDSLPQGASAPLPPITPEAFSGRHVVLVDKPGADASISFGVPVDVHRGEREFYALWLATSWLGEHRQSASHLYKVIRSARGLNYGDYAYIEAYPNGGRRDKPPSNVARRQHLFEVWIRTLPNDRGIFALRAALREVDRLVADGLSEAQFELTRAFLSKYALSFADTTQKRLGYAIDDRYYGIGGPGEEGHLARFRRIMSELTRDEVNAAIRKHFQTKDLKIAIVTGDAKKLADILTSDTATPITYESAKPREILDEDAIIASYPLRIPARNLRIVPVDAMFER